MLSGVIEFGGGIALALGLFTRLAGLAIFGDMMMAIVTVTWANGINATGGTAGYELNLALGFLALVPAVFGAGRFSVDAVLERRLVRADATPTAAALPRGHPRLLISPETASPSPTTRPHEFGDGEVCVGREVGTTGLTYDKC